MFTIVFVLSPCFRQIAMLDIARLARSSSAGWSMRPVRSGRLASRMKACGLLDHAPRPQGLRRPLAEPPPLLVQIPPIPIRSPLPATSSIPSDGTSRWAVTINTVPRLTPGSNPRGPWCFSLSAQLTAG
jgi:hypothetical protein